MTVDSEMNNISKKNILKKIAAFVGGACASSTIEKIVRNNIPASDMKTRIVTFIGTAIIGGIVGAAASDYVETSIEEIEDTVKTFVQGSEVKEVETVKLED